jgi:hypothetical protein
MSHHDLLYYSTLYHGTPKSTFSAASWRRLCNFGKEGSCDDNEGSNGSGGGKDGGRGDAGAPVMLLETSRMTLTAMNATTMAEMEAFRVVIHEDLKETRRFPRIPKKPKETRRNQKKRKETQRNPKTVICGSFLGHNY